VTAELSLSREQHRDVLAPARLQRRLAVDIDFLDGGPGGPRNRLQRVAHLVAEMAVGARQKRKAHAVAALNG